MFRRSVISAAPVVLIAALVLFHTLPAHAEAKVTGTPEALELDVQDASIEEVLTLLGSRLGLRYHVSTALDQRITGTYTGSLRQVLARLLSGFDYIVKTNSGTVEIIIMAGKPGGPAATPVPAPRRRAD